MDETKDFPLEFIKPFVVFFNYHKICFISYFDDGGSLWRKYCFIVMVLIVFFNFVSMWIYMFRIFGSEMNISDIAFITVACLIALQSILKAIVLFPKKKDIEKMIKGLAKMWRTENLSDIQVKEKTRRLKRLNVFLSVFYWGTSMAIMQNMLPQLIFTIVGKIRDPEFDFILLFGNVYPFDPVKNWGRYLLVYIMQFCVYIRLLHYYLGVQCLIVILCSQLSTEFVLLREDIKTAVPMPNRNKMEGPIVDKNRTLEAMVKNHQELIKLADLLNHIFNRMVFIDMCFFGVIACVFAVLLTVSHTAVDRISNTASLLSMQVLIYMFCHYSEMLKEESASITDAAYENPWYEGGTHYQKTISLIIMRAQLPCCMTSLKYAPISLNTFTKVVSTTWSYFSLVMTMCGDD